jgi:hypothetical protein
MSDLIAALRSGEAGPATQRRAADRIEGLEDEKERMRHLKVLRERVDVAVWEFLSDWKKGDFSLSTLAALDAQSIAEAFDAYRINLKED